MTSKRIFAIIGIILLVALYIVSLLTAIFDKSESGSWFMASIFSTAVIPILVWIYAKTYDWLKKKKDDENEEE